MRDPTRVQVRFGSPGFAQVFVIIEPVSLPGRVESACAVLPAVQDLLVTVLLREVDGLEDLQGGEYDAERPEGEPFAFPLSDSPETLRGDGMGRVVYADSGHWPDFRVGTVAGDGCGSACIISFLSLRGPIQGRTFAKAWSRPAGGPTAFGPMERRQDETVRSGCTPFGDPLLGKEHHGGRKWVTGPWSTVAMLSPESGGAALPGSRPRAEGSVVASCRGKGWMTCERGSSVLVSSEMGIADSLSAGWTSLVLAGARYRYQSHWLSKGRGKGWSSSAG